MTRPSVGRPPSDEAGAATAELVIATPAFLFLLLLVVHVGLWFHASHVASAAAQAGAEAARRTGREAPGQAAADAFLADLGGPVLTGARVQVRVDADDARVEVTGSGPAVVPGFPSPVRAVSQGPVERFRADVP